MGNNKTKGNASGIIAHMASQSQTSKYVTGKNGSTGHGYAAEDANALQDLLKGHNIDKVGTNNAKNGADRISNGVKIQCKYYKTARSTVNSAFDNATGMYKYTVRNGRPMKLEVPADQYEKAIQIMREQIAKGKVPGVKNPEHATKMIRKGAVTYAQSVQLTKAGTIESLRYDAKTGVVSSVASAGISAVITFVSMKQQRASTKDALIESGKQASKSAGATMIAQIAVGQIGRIIEQEGVKQTGKKIIEKITNNAIGNATKEGVKKITGNVVGNMGKEILTKSNVVTAVVTDVVTIAPDVYKAAKGKITWDRCVEEATSKTGSVISGIMTSAVAVAPLSNPGGLAALGVALGTGMVGSYVGEKMTKKVIAKVKKRNKKRKRN